MNGRASANPAPTCHPPRPALALARVPPGANLRSKALLVPSVFEDDVSVGAQILVRGLQGNAAIEVRHVHAAPLRPHATHVQWRNHTEHLVYLGKHGLDPVEQRNLDHADGSGTGALLLIERMGKRLRDERQFDGLESRPTLGRGKRPLGEKRPVYLARCGVHEVFAKGLGHQALLGEHAS